MTKGKLEQYRSLGKEIELLQIAIENLRQKELQFSEDSVKGSSPDFPFTERTLKIYGIDEAERNNTINAIRNNSLRLIKMQINQQKKLSEILEFIEGLEDSKMRQIFMLRYIEGLTWQNIAFRIGESDESYPRQKHNAFLKVTENTENKVV